MLPQLAWFLAMGAKKAFESLGGSRSNRVGYDIYTVNPDKLRDFMRQFPDTVLATSLYEEIAGQDPSAANDLLATMRRLRVERPGTLVVCCNFTK